MLASTVLSSTGKNHACGNNTGLPRLIYIGTNIHAPEIASETIYKKPSNMSRAILSSLALLIFIISSLHIDQAMLVSAWLFQDNQQHQDNQDQ